MAAQSPTPDRGRRKRNANGEGNIKRRTDGRYEARAVVPLSDGTRKRVSLYGRSWEEVHEELTKLKSDAMRGVPVASATGTVADYLTYWLENIAKPRIRPSTYVGYEVAVRRYLIPGLGKKRLTKLSARDVRTWLTAVRMTCKCCTGGWDRRRAERDRRCCAAGKCCKAYLAEGRVHHLHRTLRAALQDAVQEETLSRNVAKLVRPGRGSSKVTNSFTADEARRFLAAARPNRLFAFYAVALGIGLRRGEALALRWTDVDLTLGHVRVCRTLQRIQGALIIGPPKTRDGFRMVPLPRACVDALRAHRATQTAERGAAGKAWRDHGLVFTTRLGTPIEPRNINREFDKLCAGAELRRIRFHDLRHSCATLLYAQGVEPGTIKEVLGHSSITVTMGLYVEVLQETQREAVDRLGHLFGD
jgi:integrase